MSESPPTWWRGAPGHYWSDYYRGFWHQLLGSRFAPPRERSGFRWGEPLGWPLPDVPRTSAYQDGWDDSMEIAIGPLTSLRGGA